MTHPTTTGAGASAPVSLIESCSRYDGQVNVIYRGTPQELVAAGVATQEMTQPAGKKGRRRFDPNGQRYWRVTAGGKTRPVVRIGRNDIPEHIGLALPGVREYLAIRESEEASETLQATPQRSAVVIPFPRKACRQVPMRGWPFSFDRALWDGLSDADKAAAERRILLMVAYPSGSEGGAA